ncbi:MAG: hypothetical protein LUI12_10130 [Clostridiales bacterium]|nr:hypothetical protein [Clostridiales bacterium]
MEAVMKNCKSIFISDQSKIRDTFTKLWVQVIDQEENSIKTDKNIQANII